MSRWQESFPWTASAIGFMWPEGPARRKRWLRIAVVLLALVAAHALLTAFMAARTARVADRFVARWGPLDPAVDRPGSVEDRANKARAVRAAADSMVLTKIPYSGPSNDFQNFASNPDKVFTAADRAEIRKVVADNALALSILDVAVARPGSNWGLHYEWGHEIDVPPLLPILQLAKLNGAAGRLALEDGRIDDALTALARGSAIASSLDNEPILIVQLVRLAVTRLNAVLARRILGSATLGPDQFAALDAACPPHDPRGEVRKAMIVETKAMSGLFNVGTGDTRHFSGHQEVAHLLAFGIVRTVARPYLLREERLWLETMTGRIEALERPRNARGTEHDGPAIRSWDVLVRILLVNLGGLDERCDLAEAREGLLHAAIGIERRRHDSGRPPVSLAELAPAYLHDAPIDPLTGRAFAYETDGKGWRIRSEVDLSSMKSPRINDPLLDWSR